VTEAHMCRVVYFIIIIVVIYYANGNHKYRKYSKYKNDIKYTGFLKDIFCMFLLSDLTDFV